MSRIVSNCIVSYHIKSKRIELHPVVLYLKCIIPESYRNPCIWMRIESSYEGEMHNPTSDIKCSHWSLTSHWVLGVSITRWLLCGFSLRGCSHTAAIRRAEWWRHLREAGVSTGSTPRLRWPLITLSWRVPVSTSEPLTACFSAKKNTIYGI